MATKLLPRTTCQDCGEKQMNHDEGKNKPVQVIQISEDTLRTIIQESVEEFMSRMGVSWNDPTEMQKDFATLREWRETVQSVKRKTFVSVVLIIISGLIGFIVLGFKSSLHPGP